MTQSPGVQPPAGFTLFATHAENGWNLWVPPAGEDIPTRLRRYQFVNQAAGLVGKYGPSPCASAGSAMQDPDNPRSVYTWDVQNDFSRFGPDETKPYIPQFVAMWSAYVTAIAPQYGWTQIEIGSVVNEALRVLLDSLGFEEGDTPGNYVGVMATIGATARSRCERAGWQFATSTTAAQGTEKAAAGSASQ